MVAKQKCVGVATDPNNVRRWKHKFWVPQQKNTVGHTDVEVDWRRERLETAHGAGTSPQGRRHVRINVGISAIVSRS